MVSENGHEGSEITLYKAQHNLSVFDAGSIIQGLLPSQFGTFNERPYVGPRRVHNLPSRGQSLKQLLSLIFQ